MATAPNRALHPAEVVGVRQVAPHMRRITVRGEGLRGIAFDLPGQWVKVFFPVDPGAKAHGRAYTIRHHDQVSGTMDLDFVLHGDDGVASRWAGQARTGEILQVAGPREGYKPDPSRSDHLLVGDSTSLPAIACILERLPPQVSVRIFVEVADEDERALVPAHPRSEALILTSGAGLPGTTGVLERMIREASLPSTPQVWLAGEAAMMRNVRDHLVEERGMDRRFMAASGYWRVGVQDHRD